jgi:hypothetical protein
MNSFEALTQNFPLRNEEDRDKPYFSKQVVQQRVQYSLNMSEKVTAELTCFALTINI